MESHKKRLAGFSLFYSDFFQHRGGSATNSAGFSKELSNEKNGIKNKQGNTRNN